MRRREDASAADDLFQCRTALCRAAFVALAGGGRSLEIQPDICGAKFGNQFIERGKIFYGQKTDRRASLTAEIRR